MVTKTITLYYVAEDNKAFAIEKLLRSTFAKIVEENGGKGIRIDSKVRFANDREESVLKVPQFIGK